MNNVSARTEILIGIFLIAMSFLVFQFNVINTAPSFQFKTYRDGSEALVLGKVFADIKNTKIKNANLGFVFKGDDAPRSDVLSVYERLNHDGKIVPVDLSDTNWNHGFATFGPTLLLNLSDVSKIGYGVNELQVNDVIEFYNKEIRTVTETKVAGEYLHVTYSGSPINSEDIDNREFSVLNEKIEIESYSKQFGLQGLVFSYIYRILPDLMKKVSVLQAFSALLFSIVLILLVREIAFLINFKFAIIFLLCMVGSPWIVSISRNTYWVPFLWLFPVYLSFFLFRIIKMYEFNGRSMFIYGSIFGLSIFIKSLCGYEYLPLIIIFSLLPFFLELSSSMESRVVDRPLRSCSVIILFSVIGFFIALLIHASLRSDDIIEGLIQTIRLDAFKYNAIGPIIGAPSYGIESSYIDLAVKYIFDWNGAIYFGIESQWVFPILLFGSFAVVVANQLKKRKVWTINFILWLTAFFSSISWSILMKDHSVIHTHLNFVLWYLFFIPVATYLIFEFFLYEESCFFRLFRKKSFVNNMALQKFEESKINNFTLLRIVLAIAVLFGHSFPIVGKGSDPISVALLQPTEWLGSIAVHCFFFISGFLVVASFVRRGAIKYILSRVLRLYPAILVYSVIVILIIGPIFSNVSLSEYISARPWFNLLNAGLWEWNYNLPFVFENNPIPIATNGSAWTLPVELRCYILILFIGFFGALDNKIRANCALISLLMICFFSYSYLPMFGSSINFRTPLIYFLTGSLFWVNRGIIPMNSYLAIFSCFLTVLSIKTEFLYIMLPLFIGYLVLAFVYILPYAKIDKVGDLSYGIYIYAWPIQQLVWAPNQGPYENFVISLLLVLFFAFFSWRFVEKPAINFRKAKITISSN